MSVEAMAAGGPKARRGGAWGLAAVLAGVGAILALLVGGMVLIPRYRAAYPASDLQRSDADRVVIDDLYLDLTLVTPEFLASRELERFLGGRAPESVLPLIVGVNAHKGSIEHMHHLNGELRLVGEDGARYPALTEPIVLTDHHNAYMLLFPPRDHHGRPFLERPEGSIVVEATGIGDVPVRRFEWRLPLTAERGGGLVATLMLVVALAGALLVVLSPCALELTVYYAAIISATIDESERERMVTGGLGALDGGRRRVLVNLGAFVAGFTLLYSLAGATVGLIGQGVRQPLGEWALAIQLAGGGLILFFALRILGLGSWLGRRVAPAGAREMPAEIPPGAPAGARGIPGGAIPGGARGLLAAGARGMPGGARGLLAAGAREISGGARGLLAAARGRIRGLLARVRFHGERRAAERGTMRAADSFLVGIGLSSACLGCMGGAVLYPLLVYAGITSWYSGLVTLGLYSLAIALPMVAIALGFSRLRLGLAGRLGVNRALRITSGVLLGGIGLLILTGRERILTDVVFGLMGEVSRWLA